GGVCVLPRGWVDALQSGLRVEVHGGETRRSAGQGLSEGRATADRVAWPPSHLRVASDDAWSEAGRGAGAARARVAVDDDAVHPPLTGRPSGGGRAARRGAAEATQARRGG